MMKIRILAVLVLLLAAASGRDAFPEVVGEEGGRALTIRDAIRTAFINKKTIQIQEQELVFAKADIMYAKSRFLPQVGLSYSYTLNDAVPSYGPLSRGLRKDFGVWSGYKNDNLFTLEANETIYNGGANIASLQQSKIGLKIQDETLIATKLDVEFETKRLFYGLLLGYETLRIAEDLVDQAQAHYDEVRMMYSEGTASKFDLLQSKTQVAVLIPQLVNAQNAIILITAELKKELGVNMLQPIRIDGDLAYVPIEIDEEEFLREAYSKNPRMILKLLGVDLQKWAIELAKAGWLPTVAGKAGYSYRSDDIGDMFNPRHDLWYVGVQASIAIFDGFATKAKVDEAKARYAQAGLRKEDITDQLVVDVKSACVNLKQAQAIIESQRESIVEAEEALRLSRVRYTNGIGINLDVFDAEVSLAQIQENLAQGIYDYTMAKAQIDRVTGRLYQDGN